jgi:hypothetical protein
MRHTVAVLLLCLCSAMAARAADVDKAKLEKTVDTMLKAYNEGDAKTFNAQYAKTMAAVATEQTFNTLYKGQAMDKYGKFESKKAIDKETVATGDFPLLVYEGKFAKAEKVKISVNFTKDGDELKVMQVRFDPM